MDNLKKTSLHDKHVNLGAKIVPFANHLMPLLYSGVKSEHINTRNNASVFDVSHMGLISVKGRDSVKFLNYITTNNVKKLYNNKIQYSCFINDKGGIVDDLLIYMINVNEYLLIVNSSNIDKDLLFMKQYNCDHQIEIVDNSNLWSIIALQGPKSQDILIKFLNIYDIKVDLSKIKYYHFITIEHDKIGEVIISTTGYTGSGGFEIYIKNDYSNLVWENLFSIGDLYDLKPAGLAARDTLRLEMGFCLYGNDINNDTTPIEANLNFIVDFDKDFLGKNILLKQIENGCHKKLVAFSVLDKGIPRKGYNILDNNNNIIGAVTSGTMSPSINKGIGLAYINTNFVNENCFIDIRGKKMMIIFEKLPFYKVQK